jgi:hypothetical protein
MSWASYGDDFTSRPFWDNCPPWARWHYISLVERCCRDRRWDGRLPLAAALRTSDSPQPEVDLKELEARGLVTITDDTVSIVYIDEHIPPPKSRPEALAPRKRENQRAHRQRQCDRGNHDPHCPKGCPARGGSGSPSGSPAGSPVTPGTGTGRVRDGETQPRTKETEQNDAPRRVDDDPWPAEAAS